MDTLVVLMGVGQLSQISATLIRHGRAPDTPVALIERGTSPGERVVTGTLADIAERAAAASVRPPATIVIGEVVRLRDALFCPPADAPALNHEHCSPSGREAISFSRKNGDRCSGSRWLNLSTISKSCVDS
jgi:hypothetical protein